MVYACVRQRQYQKECIGDPEKRGAKQGCFDLSGTRIFNQAK